MEKQVALSSLVVSRDNVRRTNPLEDIPLLAALIKSQGLLQKILVRDNGDGKYRVVDGKRRRAALRLLADRGDWPKGKPVPIVILSDDHNDTEVSLAANLGRVDMHPADTYEAFRRLIEDEGATPDSIAGRFGYAVSTVNGFLKLANISPRLMKAFRKDDITLEQIKALAITDDHTRQEAAFYDSPDYRRDPRSLRRLIMAGRLDGDDKLARFVGLEAYEAAGGQTTRDLFGAEGEIYIEDSGLLHQLATAKLETEADRLRKQGWKWVEINLDLSQFDLSQHLKVSVAAHGFGPESKTARIYAGVILGVDFDGQLKVVTGVLKAADAKALASAKADLSDPSLPATVSSNIGGKTFAATMIEELTAIKTAALRAEIAARPDLALALVVHDLALPVFYGAWESDKQLSELKPQHADIARLIKNLETCKPLADCESNLERWRGVLPARAFELWLWLIAQEQSLLLELLSVAIAENVNASWYRHERTRPVRVASTDRLAISLGLDMTKWWRPDAEFFSRNPKAAILAAIAEGVSPETARGLDRGSKADLVAVAERKLSDSTWLPDVLRTREQSEDRETVDSEHELVDGDLAAAE